MNDRLARPAYELQATDFQSSPVWSFVTPEEAAALGVDESFVVAQACRPGIGQFGSHLVAATYEVRDGSVLPGAVQVDVLDTQIEFTPSSVFAAGKSVDPLGHDTGKRLERLLKKSDVQPTRWRLSVVLSNEREVRSGSIAKPGLSQTLELLAQLVRLKLSRRGR